MKSIWLRSTICLIALLTAPLAAAADRPNLVFMIADDCTYLDMEVYGGQAKTPHLNRLASEGMQFSRCFQAAPMCSPTRHNIYTGLYPVKSGAWPNHTCVYPGTKSIAHYLQAAGYRVALSGKTHISPKQSFPFEYDKEFREANIDQNNPFPTIERLIVECQGQDQPFCLFACSNEPHSPWDKGDATAYPVDQLELPPSWVDTPQTRLSYANYLAEITYFDAQCGVLLELLERHGVASNTLVICVSEQGSSFPFAKWTCFELGLSSGMIARWPGKIRAGSNSGALVEYCDVTPTFLDAARVPIPENLDGRSFLPVLLGQQEEHKHYTFGIQTTRGINNGSKAFGIRSCGTKTHRYIRNLHSETVFTNAVTRTEGSQEKIWGSWLARAEQGDAHAKAMVKKYQRRPPEEFYDVVADPHCLNNLIDDPKQADRIAELSAQLDQWMDEQGDAGAKTEEMAHTRSAKYQAKKTRRIKQSQGQ